MSGWREVSISVTEAMQVVPVTGGKYSFLMRQLSMNAFTLCIVFLIAFDDVYGTTFNNLGCLCVTSLNRADPGRRLCRLTYMRGHTVTKRHTRRSGS